MNAEKAATGTAMKRKKRDQKSASRAFYIKRYNFFVQIKSVSSS